MKLTSHKDEKFIQIYEEISDIFLKNHCNGREIKAIFNMFLCIPYCIDGKRYVYGTNFYDDISELPKEALEQLVYKAERMM